MSTMTVQVPTTPPNSRPDVTWRDAATPLSRASRRRWTACYVLLLVLLAASVVAGADLPLVMLIAVPVVFGMLRRGTRRITALDHPELDERDIHARNSAYRIAFPLLVLAVATGLGLLAAFGLTDETRTTRIDANSVLEEAIFGIHPWALTGLALWTMLWAAFLPTGVLAWREPDALELELAEDSGGLSEPVRDAVLGVSLAAGAAVSLLADTDAAALLFVAALALVGALGRRAAGQPAMSRQRKLRVAIGIALIVIVVALAFAFAGTGGEGEGGIVDNPHNGSG